MKKLGDHVMDSLSVLKEDPPRDEGHWLQMKCQCDTASLTLELGTHQESQEIPHQSSQGAQPRLHIL